MELKIKRLFIGHFLFFFMFYDIRSVLETQNIEILFDWFEFKNGLLNLSSLFVFFCFSLGAYLILYRYYPKSIFKIIVGLPGIMILVILGRYFIEEIFFIKVFGFDNYHDNMSMSLYVLRNMSYAIIHLGIGCVFFFVQYSAFKETLEQKLLTENKNTELAYLRSQVNPHFLFNTLNNIYSLVFQKSEQALPALEKLTDLLRYGLYEKSEKIALGKEISMIENFITLEEIRYAFPLKTDFIVEGNISNIMIPPFFLLPFVENAFKHGDTKARIKIHLCVVEKTLNFNVENLIKIKQKDEEGGIGLENIKKRLELIYGDNQQLIISKKDTFFSVRLKIKT